MTSGNGNSSNPELTIDVNNGVRANATSTFAPELVLNLGNSTPEIAFNFGNNGGNGASLTEIVLNLTNGGNQPRAGFKLTSLRDGGLFSSH